MRNHENLGFSKNFAFPKMFLGDVWDIGGVRTRTRTAPGGLLRRLRRPQEIARGAEVCGERPVGVGPLNLVVTNLKNHEKHEKS